MPLAAGVVGNGNLDPWPKSRSMGETCEREGRHSVGSEKQKGGAVCYLGMNVMEKVRGLSRDFNT